MFIINEVIDSQKLQGWQNQPRIYDGFLGYY